MKVAGIFRGFPGLGRVVSGVETLRIFQKYHNAEISIFSYFQGFEYCKDIFETYNIFAEKDISSIGIIPVSQSGEVIIDEIEKINPDIILIDGEPLLLTTIKLRFPNIKVITLLNPFDVENPHNKLSSQLFFKDCYAKADYAIVHGIWKVEQPKEFANNFYSIHTILRSEILSIQPNKNTNRIVCILGGGSINGSSSFFKNTLEIAKKAFFIAELYSDFQVDIFCSCEDVFQEVTLLKYKNKNVTIHKELKNSREMYSNTKLVLARAGRNTISELLHLQIPSLLFATSCNIRGSEQSQNLKSVKEISQGQLLGFDIMTSENPIPDFAMSNNINNNWLWESGNNDLENLILHHFA